MTVKNKLLSQEEIDKAIAAAYRDGPFLSGLINRIAVLRNPELREIYRKYRRTARSVKRIKLEKCPNYVVDGLKTEKKSFLADFFGNVSYSKLSFTVVTIVLFAVTIFYNLEVGQQKKMFTEHEISLRLQSHTEEKEAAVPPSEIKAAAPAETEVRVVPHLAKIRKKHTDPVVTEQVKESLAFVANVLLKTDAKIGNNNPFEIVEKQLNKSIKAVNNLLTGGKDEM